MTLPWMTRARQPLSRARTRSGSRRIPIIAASIMFAGCIGIRPIPSTPLADINIVLSRGPADDLASWTRMLRTASGLPLTPEHYRPGEPVRVLWYRDFPRDKKDVRTWAGIERRCANPSRPPHSWRIAVMNQAANAGSLRRISGDGDARINRGDRTVNVRDAAPILSSISVGLDEEVRWLAYVPDRAERVVVLEWMVNDLAEAETIRPCDVRWVPVDENLYFATLVNSNANGLQSGSEVPWLDPRSSVPLDSARMSDAVRLLGLIGSPEFDLVRLHQIAWSLEVGGSVSAGVDATTLRMIREERLSRLLSAGPEGRERLCRVTFLNHLYEPVFALWAGQATVPEHLIRSCPEFSRNVSSDDVLQQRLFQF